jgi:uncharacterized membrane-anchored protein
VKAGAGRMKFNTKKLVASSSLMLVGMFIGGAGIYIGETDDAPGAAVIGIFLMLVLFFLGLKLMRRNSRSSRADRSTDHLTIVMFLALVLSACGGCLELCEFLILTALPVLHKISQNFLAVLPVFGLPSKFGVSHFGQAR